MRMFFDTETTDYWSFDKKPTDDSQPLLAQIAWVLEDDAGRTVSANSAILAQDHWPNLIGSSQYRPRIRMTDRVIACHGITDAMVDKYGQPAILVMQQFLRDLSRCTEVVGHNVEFDVGVVNRTLVALMLPPIVWPATYCTKIHSTKIVGIRSANGGFKWPNLGEAYYFFTGSKLNGAHDALVDVYGCRKVFRGIKGKTDAA